MDNETRKAFEHLECTLIHELYRQTKVICIVQVCYVVTIMATAAAQIIKLFVK